MGRDLDFRRVVRFWEDRWCRENPLKINFLEAFRIVENKEAKIAEYIAHNGGEISYKKNSEKSLK